MGKFFTKFPKVPKSFVEVDLNTGEGITGMAQALSQGAWANRLPEPPFCHGIPGFTPGHRKRPGFSTAGLPGLRNTGRPLRWTSIDRPA